MMKNAQKRLGIAARLGALVVATVALVVGLVTAPANATSLSSVSAGSVSVGAVSSSAVSTSAVSTSGTAGLQRVSWFTSAGNYVALGDSFT